LIENILHDPTPICQITFSELAAQVAATKDISSEKAVERRAMLSIIQEK